MPIIKLLIETSNHYIMVKCHSRETTKIKGGHFVAAVSQSVLKLPCVVVRGSNDEKVRAAKLHNSNPHRLVPRQDGQPAIISGGKTLLSTYGERQGGEDEDKQQSLWSPKRL